MTNDVSPEPENNTLIIRDRRGRSQFSIHNRIIDQWFPIIGPYGYSLYSLYVRMADQESEKSYPSIRMIASHMGMGAATISDYNRILAWCRLIHIQDGGRTKSNTYYILDIPEVNDDAIEHLQQQIQFDIKRRTKQAQIKIKNLHDKARKIIINAEKQKLLTKAQAYQTKIDSGIIPPILITILDRIDNWQPIKAHWSKTKQKAVITTIPAAPTPQPQLPITEIQKAKPSSHHTTNLLDHIGIVGKNAKLLSTTYPENALAWYWTVLLEEMNEKYIPGYIVNQLKTQTPPPVNTADLASKWLSLDPSDREILRAHVHSYTATGTNTHDSFAQFLPEEFLPDLYEESLNVFYQLYKSNAYFTDW